MSRIVNETRLNYYTIKLWERIKLLQGDYVHKVNDTTNVGGVGQNDKVVKLDNNGLLDVTMLPEISINRHYTVANLVDAEAQRGNYQNGDVIYDQDTQKTYLVINNEPNNNFQQDAIIELSPQAGNIGVENVTYDQNTKELVVTIGGQDTRHSLSDLIDVTDVKYDDVTNIITVTKNNVVENIDLSKLNTTINSHTPVDGNIDLNLNKAGDNIELTVQGQQVANVDLTDYVKTVNNQPNQGGNVTVNAEHVPYDKNQTNLNATNVQEAINEVYDNFKGGYVASNFDPQTGQLTLTKHEGNPDILNLGVHVEDAQLDNNTNTLKLIKADATTIDVPLDPILIANKITFTPGATGMVATNVQDAIEELKTDMALLDDSDVYIVQNKTELENLLIQTQLKTGDIIYIINSDGVEDYNGVNVNNGTNPVAMIYDDNATNNKLRVFSKVDTVINIDAHNVKYDDQITQLGANDVQEAIEKLVTVTNKKAEGITNDGTNVNLVDGNQIVLSSIPLMTQQEVDSIIAQFV